MLRKEIIIGIVIASTLMALQAHLWLQVQPISATGCPVDTIIPFLDDAMKSLEAGDIKTAQSQLQDVKNELSDSFEVEE